MTDRDDSLEDLHPLGVLTNAADRQLGFPTPPWGGTRPGLAQSRSPRFGAHNGYD